MDKAELPVYNIPNNCAADRTSSGTSGTRPMGKRGNLTPAHAGYQYQDLLTAYIFAQSLFFRYESVTVDRKVVEDDRFDDLGVTAEQTIRRQIKSSQHRRELSLTDFTKEDSSLRIDRLVQTYTTASGAAADEYRLCATWSLSVDNPLSEMLEPLSGSLTVSGSESKQYRLRGESIWPETETSAWSWLGGAGRPTRVEFLAFCDRFVIELELPPASRSFALPGQLEQALLDILVVQIGIGKYPNHDRYPSDVAAVLVALANRARTDKSSLTPIDIEIAVGLRTDYGRIAQQFPLDPHVFHNRPGFRTVLRMAALRGEHLLIVGPPGAGKSWELTQLSDELRSEGAIVIRHYCYLEPGDEYIERRVTTNALFANLLADMTDTEPSLRNTVSQRYSAGPRELEEMLTQAVELGRPVVLIVDGIDHIMRVRAQALGLSVVETDIVDQLAALQLPSGVSLVLGSQPGEHLVPLRKALGTRLLEQPVPRWIEADVMALAERLGVTEVLIQMKIPDPSSALNLLAVRSEGNPLYATYLSRSLISGLREGVILNPVEWLQQAPVIEGDITRYYSHLYNHASVAAKAIADVLGVIDFGITESELQEILSGPLRGWITPALRDLASILTNVTGQGGIRVFHESFRRFMVDEFIRQGRSIADVLDPVIEWLVRRGFFDSAHSFRFLLPTLRRAGRIDEALAKIDVQFVSTSIAAGHPRLAIERNIVLAADMAAEALRWSELIRCVELHRSVWTCFEEKLYNPLPYWQAYLALFGPTALAERLLFDGQPTYDAETGMILCSMIDDAGVVAPWQEYLALRKRNRERTADDTTQRYEDEHQVQQRRLASIAALHGRIRTDGFTAVKQSLVALLTEYDNVPASYASGIANRIIRSAGTDALEGLIATVTDPTCVPTIVDARLAVCLKLVLAQSFADDGDGERAAAIAQDALQIADTPALALRCRKLGARSDDAVARAGDPSTIPLGFGHQTMIETDEVEAWIASIRLLAEGHPQVLVNERTRVTGEGWYRCWLQFVIGLAEIEVLERTGQDAVSSVRAFEELTRDMHPFTGQPRAMDLFRLYGTIADTLAWGLSLLKTEEEWRTILDILETVIKHVSSSLDRESPGPIHIETILELLLPYAGRQDVGSMICTFAEGLVDWGDASGVYFETHAERGAWLARIFQADGNVAEARERWANVGVYLGGYGFRKDITIYDILDSIAALQSVSQDAALEALIAAQPLAQAMLLHTDGRETKHAPNAWFRSLLTCHPEAGLALLAQAIAGPDVPMGWRIDEALHDALQAVNTTADPMLVAAVYETLPFEVDDDSESETRADERLAVVSRFLDQDRGLGLLAFQHVAVQVDGDSRQHAEKAWQRTAAFAQAQGLPLANKSLASDIRQMVSERDGILNSKGEAALIQATTTPFLFSPAVDLPSLIVDIRRITSLPSDDITRNRQWLNGMGYRLVILAANGQEVDVVRLLRFFTHSVYVPRGYQHPLSDIAQGLDRYGYAHSAAIAYALAYTYTYGGGGYLSLGSEQHQWLLLRGIELDREAALAVLATEISAMLQRSNYNAGITKHIIERATAWGEPAIAKACWWSAYHVIAHRLPPVTEREGVFGQFQPAALPNYSIDEGLLAVLLVRVDNPVLYRKTAALAGVERSLQYRPDMCIHPLSAWLLKEIPLTSRLLLLHLLYMAEESYHLARALRQELAQLAVSSLWGVQLLARQLLLRAGLDVPEAVYPAAPDVRNVVLSPRQTQHLQAFVVSDRFEWLDELWPDLSTLVLRRAHVLNSVDAEAQQRRAHARFELSYGRDRDTHPPTPVLFWEAELLEIALHEMLNGLKLQLWRTGRWNEQIEEAVLWHVLPNTVMHMMLHASRDVRPQYPHPQDVATGVSNIVTVHDSRYPNWKRIGYIERQWIGEHQSYFEPPGRSFTVFAGAVVVPLQWQPQSDDFPFHAGDVADWLHSEGPTDVLPQLTMGQLLGAARLSDWLGDGPVLVPPRELRTLLNLQPAQVGEQLIWCDNAGQPALVLRTWRLRDANQLWGEPRTHEGMDIIVRPDIFVRIIEMAVGSVRELAIVQQQQL
jgi:hypothetical protein